MRWIIGGLGLLVGVYGGYLLESRQEGVQLVGALKFLVGGIVVHDVAIAAAVLVVGVVVTRVLPRAARAPFTVGAIVLGSVTLLAIPVLGRYGARSDNSTLLNRDYGQGWWIFAGVIVAAVIVASVIRTRQAGPASVEPVAGDD